MKIWMTALTPYGFAVLGSDIASGSPVFLYALSKPENDICIVFWVGMAKFREAVPCALEVA